MTLVWSDYPSALGASKNLVNDLDLVVTSPSGAAYQGNVFSGGWSQTGGSADRTNNVENVYVTAAEARTWTVTVSGYNVPQGPQPFALVVDGELGAPAPTSTPAPTNTSAPPTATSEPTATPVPPTPTNTPAPTDVPTNTPTPTATTPPPTATPTAEPTGSSHVGDLDSLSESQNRNRWWATVTILVHDDSESPVANATIYGTWSDGVSGSDSCVTDGSGTCAITSLDVFKDPSITFTVDNVTHSALSYDAASNHDPDGDSSGTTIIINQ